MKKHILIVACASDVLQTFPATLTLAGHRVKVACSGLQAIKEARDTCPDVIILDTTLPDMDGETIQEILQRLPSTAGITTLLLEPRPNRLAALSLPEGRRTDGLARPLESGELLLQVANALALCQHLDLEQRDLAREMALEAV